MSDLIIGDDEFDLEQLLNDPDFLNDVDLLNDSPGHVSDPDQDPKQKFAEIEDILMNDEFDDDKNNEFLFDVLLDSPVESEASRGEVVNGFDSKASSPEVENGGKDACEGEEDDRVTKNDSKESDDGGEDDDPVTKKRKRYFMIFDDFLDLLIEC